MAVTPGTFAPGGDAGAAHAAATFLRASGLPGRWAWQRRFTVLDIGFGLGHRFLATWAAWQADASRCEALTFIALEPHPPRRADLVRAHAAGALGTQVQALAPALARTLAQAWPPLTPNVHVLDFDGGRVRLLLALGAVEKLLPAMLAEVDAFGLNDPAAVHDRRFFAGLARLARPGATLTAPSLTPDMRSLLVAHGFAEQSTGAAQAGAQADAQPGAQPSAQAIACYAPKFVPKRRAGRVAAAHGGERTAVVVGGGVAGASAAAALARLGWQCTVLDQHGEPASAASGNPAALFHGTAHAAEGVHTRLHRAAALLAAQRYAALVATGRVAGAVGGLRRLGTGAVWADLPAGLPADYVEPVDNGAALHYPGGGWIAPRALVREWLGHPRISFVGHSEVHHIERRGAQWSALGPQGQGLASAAVLVLAGAQGNELLVRSLGQTGWATQRERGQVTWFDSAENLRLPTTGQGYAVALPGGQLLCGATSNGDDPDAAVRQADHRYNLDRLHRLTGIQPAPGSTLHGRVGWRSQSSDRLPIVGAVPMALADMPPGARLGHAASVPRLEGLYVLGGLGSRGVTWAPLMGDVLAAWVDGAPLPLEADLLNAIDPARWLVRAARRRG